MTHQHQKAHQNGHDYYRTTCPDRCDLADKRTAKLTITPRAFLGAAILDHRIPVIAETLGTTPAVVQAFLDNLPPEEFRALARITGRM
ncbi:hypothetical protein [Arthrobacter sp. SD76]|uniref:hypothetical protein n=1 Tax=Arthrobacter sp. SD76 TaxID=3415007 RepID=UPI003C79169A